MNYQNEILYHLKNDPNGLLEWLDNSPDIVRLCIVQEFLQITKEIIQQQSTKQELEELENFTRQIQAYEQEILDLQVVAASNILVEAEIDDELKKIFEQAGGYERVKSFLTYQLNCHPEKMESVKVLAKVLKGYEKRHGLFNAADWQALDEALGKEVE